MTQKKTKTNTEEAQKPENKSDEQANTVNNQENETKFADKVEKKQEQPQEQPNYQKIIEDMNDKVLRAAAEVQNIRRRAELDVQKARSFSIESFAKDLLSVMDNLTRATESIIDASATNPNLEAVKEGVEITRKELSNVFERNNIKCINPLGEKFDHNLHQAMSQIEDANSESGTIVNVMQVGYIIKDRLLRPAMVVVVK